MHTLEQFLELAHEARAHAHTTEGRQAAVAAILETLSDGIYFAEVGALKERADAALRAAGKAPMRPIHDPDPDDDRSIVAWWITQVDFMGKGFRRGRLKPTLETLRVVGGFAQMAIDHIRQGAMRDPDVWDVACALHQLYEDLFWVNRELEKKRINNLN
jgi:hypothetical protein